MLTIHSGINQNLRSVQFGRRDSDRSTALDKVRAQYEEDEDRTLWESQRNNFEELIAEKEAKLPKPMKAAMKGGSILAAGVLGGMATGWSAKYIFAAFKDMAGSNVAKKAGEKFNEFVSAPLGKGLKSVKNFMSKKLTALENTKTYKNSKQSLVNKLNKFEDSKFAKSIKSFGEKITGNKFVQKVASGIDSVFGFLAEGVVKAYNKLAGINYKKAAVNTLSVAGGISTGAVEAMDSVKKSEGSEGEE